MLVKDLIAALSAIDPNTEVFLSRPGNHYGPGYSSTNLKMITGHVVRDPEERGGLYTRAAGCGFFFDEVTANKVMSDGKKFLDLSSPNIHPAVQLELGRDFVPPPVVKRK
jgi:hypothetical protein